MQTDTLHQSHSTLVILILSLIEIFEKASLQLISSLHGRFIQIAFDEIGKDFEIAPLEKKLDYFSQLDVLRKDEGLR